MAFTAVAAALSVAGSVQARSDAKKQAAAVAEQARLQAKQAAESARGSALSAQTAAERQRVTAEAQAVASQAADLETPDIEIAAASAPGEANRRRQVRASFNVDDEASGSIRL